MPEPQANGAESTTGRPFPWICPRCRKNEVRPATIAYRTERLHEGRLIAVDIPNLDVPKCSNCGELIFNYTADEQILAAVKSQTRARSSAIANEKDAFQMNLTPPDQSDGICIPSPREAGNNRFCPVDVDPTPSIRREYHAGLLKICAFSLVWTLALIAIFAFWLLIS